jgi:D-alanine-D-alanine ligase
LIIPAELTESQLTTIQNTARQTYRSLFCSGMIRIDGFLLPNETFVVVVNEVNTIPGFTNISMYPKLWESDGLSQTELIDRLIQLAVEDS